MHPQLATAATTARQTHARGLRVAFAIELKKRPYEHLDEEEQEPHQRYHTGQLDRKIIDAKKEFGHGRGVPDSLSIKQMANLTWSFRQNSHEQPLAGAAS